MLTLSNFFFYLNGFYPTKSMIMSSYSYIIKLMCWVSPIWIMDSFIICWRVDELIAAHDFHYFIKRSNILGNAGLFIISNARRMKQTENFIILSKIVLCLLSKTKALVSRGKQLNIIWYYKFSQLIGFYRKRCNFIIRVDLDEKNWVTFEW